MRKMSTILSPFTGSISFSHPARFIHRQVAFGHDIWSTGADMLHLLSTDRPLRATSECWVDEQERHRRWHRARWRAGLW